MRDDLPVTFAFNGTNYVGFAGQKISRESLESGGFLDDLDRRLHVPVFTVNSSGSFVNTFPGPTPSHGDTLSIVSDGTFKIETVTRAQDNLLLSYGLMTTNR